MDTLHIMGVFEGEEPLVKAFRRMKEEKVEMADVFTPFPIHEVLENHGRKSKMTIAAWFYGLFAALGVFFTSSAK